MATTDNPTTINATYPLSIVAFYGRKRFYMPLFVALETPSTRLKPKLDRDKCGQANPFSAVKRLLFVNRSRTLPRVNFLIPRVVGSQLSQLSDYRFDEINQLSSSRWVACVVLTFKKNAHYYIRISTKIPPPRRINKYSSTQKHNWVSNTHSYHVRFCLRHGKCN